MRSSPPVAGSAPPTHGGWRDGGRDHINIYIYMYIYIHLAYMSLGIKPTNG